jgi:Tol biopolymer transport system component
VIVKPERTETNLILVIAALCILFVGWPSHPDAQYVPRRFKRGPVVDIADVPLNRVLPDYQWDSHERNFFPSLLGLHSPGARAIRTKYFAIYYTQAEDTARRIALIADEVFEQLSSYYPGSMDRFAPVHVIVSDDVDYLGNAGSLYLANYIVFWATPSNWDVRGTNNWIRDVFTHELTHHVTHKAAHNSLPFSFGILSASRSNENPDFSFTLPLSHEAMPSWFSEGIAQFESKQYGGDRWDAHRDMLLRMATLENDLLSYTNMGVFSKDGFHSEQVYNQGFALLNYVEEVYGTEKVRSMSRARPWVNFKSSVKKSVGISADRLYSDWKAHLTKKYGAVADSIGEAGEREGELISDRGSVESFPVYSPDGTHMAYLSNEGSDYGITQMLLMDLATRRVTEVARSRQYDKYVDLPFCFTPDGSKLIYNKVAGGYWDIFEYNLLTKKEKRLTIGLRGRDPAVSPDGMKIAFVGNKDGTTNLGVVDIDGTNARYLTRNNDGTQYYTPRWSSDGKQILFGIFRGEDRDIALISSETTLKPKKTSDKLKTRREFLAKKLAARGIAEGDSAQALADSLALSEAARQDSLVAFPDSLAYANNAAFEVILNSDADERGAVWLPDGSGILFTSNRTGIYNVYSYDFATGRHQQITNVIGGAFSPNLSSNGRELLYTGYHAANYNIYRIQMSRSMDIAATDSLSRDYRSIYTGKDTDDMFDVGRYGGRLASFGIMPIAVLGPTFIGNRFGLDQLSLGAEASWGDLLGSDNFSTGFTIGKNLKTGVDLNSDLFFSYQKGMPTIHTEHRSYSPTIYVGGGRQTINSLIDQGIVASRRDTTTGTLQVVIDSTLRLVPNVTQYSNLSLTEEDKFKNIFNDLFVGTEFRVGRRQAISLSYGHRRYSESIHVNQVILDSTRMIQTLNGVASDITGDIPGVGDVQEVLDDFLYQDLDFFKSNDLGVGWRYVNFTPAKDLFVNPSGGRALTFRYRRINATITDSLALTSDLNEDGVPDPTSNELSPTLFRDDKVKMGINEYIGSWNEFITLPGRTTLALQGFVAYKDKHIKTVQQDGGTSEGVFYFPLRYYLGGQGTLRGYPYFSVSGGKVAFGRASFTFPIFQSAAKELPPFFFDKIYGTFFIETGAAGNAPRLKDIDFNRDAFLTDYGFELRMQMFSNYWIPMFGYFQVAFPTRRSIPDRNNPSIINNIDSRRFYFGLTL